MDEEYSQEPGITMDPQFSQTTMTNGHPLITPERIAELASGYALSLIMEAAIRYNIFDILDDGPRTVQEVRDANGASVRGLTAVMNALAGLGLMLKRPSRPVFPSSREFRFPCKHETRISGGIASPLQSVHSPEMVTAE